MAERRVKNVQLMNLSVVKIIKQMVHKMPERLSLILGLYTMLSCN